MKVLIVSDIHADADALDRIIVKERNWDVFIVAGDIVGYGYEPNEVIETLKGLENVVAVMGNHDYAVLTGWTDMFRPEAAEVIRWTAEMIRGENRAWLKGLPVRVDVPVGGKTITVVHGSPEIPLWGYVFPWEDKNNLRRYLKNSGDFLVVGHTHIPFTFEWETKKHGKKVLINAGSPSFPRGGTRPTYVVIETKDWKVKFKEF